MQALTSSPKKFPQDQLLAPPSHSFHRPDSKSQHQLSDDQEQFVLRIINLMCSAAQAESRSDETETLHKVEEIEQFLVEEKQTLTSQTQSEKNKVFFRALISTRNLLVRAVLFNGFWKDANLYAIDTETITIPTDLSSKDQKLLACFKKLIICEQRQLEDGKSITKVKWDKITNFINDSSRDPEINQDALLSLSSLQKMLNLSTSQQSMLRLRTSDSPQAMTKSRPRTAGGNFAPAQTCSSRLARLKERFGIPSRNRYYVAIATLVCVIAILLLCDKKSLTGSFTDTP